MEVWIGRSGSRYGPYSVEQVLSMMAAGELDRTDLGWRAGLPDWIPLDQIVSWPPAPPRAPTSAAAPRPPTESTASPPSPGVGPTRPAAGTPPPPNAHPAGSPSAAFADGTPRPPGILPKAAEARIYAGFWRRVAAYLIDSLVLCAAWVPIWIALFGAASILGEDAFDGFVALCWVLELLVSWLYSAGMDSSSHQGTVGKLALGIRVADLEGRRVSFARATGRYFALFLTGFTLGIGYLMCLWTERRQCLHDLVAACVCLRADAARTPTEAP
jgi:uncharacterized RDD family membrane protein YckC